MKENRHIVIFDGVCKFCNKSVNFIIKRDPEGLFVFTPMQTEPAKKLMEKYNIANIGIDTLILIKNDKCYIFSSAALEIAKDLSGLWRLFYIFKWVPRFIRDFFYNLFGRYRYTLFGKHDVCMVPNEEVKSRFVGMNNEEKIEP